MNNYNNKHLNLDQRLSIEQGINDNLSFSSKEVPLQKYLKIFSRIVNPRKSTKLNS